MKKVSFISGLFLALSLQASAQVDDRSFILSAAPQASIPLGDFKTTNAVGWGGNLIADIKVTETTRAQVSVSGVLFQGKKYMVDNIYEDTYPAIPITQYRVGVKQFIVKGLFCSGQLGYAQGFEKGNRFSGFNFAPAFGIEFGNIRYFDFSIRYEVSNIKTATSNNIRTLGLSLAYHI